MNVGESSPNLIILIASWLLGQSTYVCTCGSWRLQKTDNFPKSTNSEENGIRLLG
jgi:hypothetical protein